VFCEIHSHMSAVIRVFDHRGSRCREDGTFTIDDVPPAITRWSAWHERIGERRDQVTIRAGAATQINFTLPVLEPGHERAAAAVTRAGDVVPDGGDRAWRGVRVLSLRVRDQVRQSVADNLASAQQVFTRVEARRQQDMRASVATLAENPT
jgi:hypothetical protein